MEQDDFSFVTDLHLGEKASGSGLLRNLKKGKGVGTTPMTPAHAERPPTPAEATPERPNTPAEAAPAECPAPPAQAPQPVETAEVEEPVFEES